MATYGLQPVPGSVQFTGYTNTLGNVGNGPAAAASTSGNVGSNGVTQFDNMVSRVFRNGAQTLAIKQLLLTLIGAAPGGTATKTKPQVQWQQGSPGGLIPIETISQVNRVTTAADVTAFTALFSRNPWPATYPPDLSGQKIGSGGTW